MQEVGQLCLVLQSSNDRQLRTFIETHLARLSRCKQIIVTIFNFMAGSSGVSHISIDISMKSIYRYIFRISVLIRKMRRRKNILIKCLIQGFNHVISVAAIRKMARIEELSIVTMTLLLVYVI